jgi:hypothetical protein
MPSVALQVWSTVRTARLDEIEDAHGRVGGTGAGRRSATRQMNLAYAVWIAAEFQGFCRDLHTESVDALFPHTTPAGFRNTLRLELLWNRRFDRGNANPGNIGADFSRLGPDFWPLVEADDARNAGRKSLLEELNRWRNAIVHQDFDPAILGGSVTLTLSEVRGWRGACNGLTRSFDEVMRSHLLSLIGTSPW